MSNHKPIIEILKTAQQLIGTVFADQTHCSYPIPHARIASGSQKFVFLYSISRLVPKQGMYIIAPDHYCIIDAKSGKIDVTKPMKPSDFGLSDEPGKTLGTYGLPKEMSREQFLVSQQRLYQLYDMIVPSFFEGIVNDKTRQASAEFRHMFGQITESVLRPYYKNIGEQFMTWLEKR
jgi:hypothetical protein